MLLSLGKQPVLLNQHQILVVDLVEVMPDGLLHGNKTVGQNTHLVLAVTGLDRHIVMTALNQTGRLLESAQRVQLAMDKY